jgi:hypothetical protein
MLKWFALILVATVLCWGDTHSHSGAGHNESGRSMETAKPSRPVDGKKIETETETETGEFDALSAKDKEELTRLIEELDSARQSQSRTGEQNPEAETTTPNL